MRVVILVQDFPQKIEEIKGGIHSAVANLLNGLQNHPVEVRLVSFNREVNQSYLVKYSSNIAIQYCAEGNLPLHSLNYFLNCPKQVKNIIKEFNPDIIHYEASDSFLFTKIFGLLGKKHLLTIHGIAMAEGKVNKNLRSKLSSYFNGLIELLLFPKNIIQISEYSKKMYAQRNIEQLAIIPNAVVPSYYSLPIKIQTDNKLLYIGGIDRRKNILFLLKAMNELQKENKFYHLEVLGGFIDDGYKLEIDSFIKENGLSNYIRFHGWVKQTDILEVIKNADILVVSSIQETLPMVIAECMAAGKAIVASTVGGIPEMVTNNVDGFLFNTDNLSTLVKSLSCLYENSALVNKMSIQARKNALTRYHSDSVARKTIQFYKEILENQL